MNNAAKPRILLVEDDPTVQNLVSTALDLHGYVVSKVCNGQAAIMDAVSHGPSLIMLDLGLPTLTVSRSSRRSEAGRQSPLSSFRRAPKIPTRLQHLTQGQTTTSPSPFLWMSCSRASLRI